jgi:hypothetical protein
LLRQTGGTTARRLTRRWWLGPLQAEKNPTSNRFPS